jgi:hypothetical protein
LNAEVAKVTQRTQKKIREKENQKFKKNLQLTKRDF